jgi:H+/Cl- antiporter ClcA
VLLVFVAVVGVVVSLLAWGFLELVFQTQVAVFTDLPRRLGFDTTPTWWPLPVLGIAGVLTSLAIVHLPGRGGHAPADGLQVGGTEPITVPGIALAGFATLALGLVLGPEGPLIAIGGGLGTFAVPHPRAIHLVGGDHREHGGTATTSQSPQEEESRPASSWRSGS